MKTHFEAYFKGLRQTPRQEQTEHTSRGALETLLRACAGADTHVQHEPKRSEKGAPDFKIQRKGAILGYVEVKKMGASLDDALKSDQIARYRTLSGNILLTDYLEWIWLDAKGVRGREILAFATDLEGKKPGLRPERVDAVNRLLAGFFSEAPQGIARSEDLAYALATRSRLLRDYLAQELLRQTREQREGRLHGLFEVFRQQVFQDLATKDFADAFAQMLAYGLFLAKLDAETKLVTLANVRQHIPGSFRLIRELVEFLAQMEEPEYAEARWVVDEVLSLVNGLDLASIKEDLSFRARKATSRKLRAGSEEEHRLFERDPFIYFYEDYLKHYDPAMRKSRGVYYTPPPIVNFIVRAVDDLLKDTFHIEDGLADSKRVTVLDFACGTGTFLLEVFEKIFENIGGPDSGRADHIVREHMLRNIHGFEYLIAPYTIAHLKLSQYLREKGHGLNDNSRLQVFLTNTLEPIQPQKNLLMPALAAEVEAAQHVKDKPILVILGNPPYSGHSKNNGKWIKGLIDDYKHVHVPRPDLGEGAEERQKLDERNSKWLNDDYVKFIRFAQHKMDQVDEGIVGIITNHSWLDNPTFRGMRQSLMRSFDQIYVLDLHGNAKKLESESSSGDENVFDIEQGVSITIFVRHKSNKKQILLDNLWGSRLEKYRSLTRLRTSDLLALQDPSAPDFRIRKVDQAAKKNYLFHHGLKEIFSNGSLGIITKRDKMVVAFDEQALSQNLKALNDINVPDIYFVEKFSIPFVDKDKWCLKQARRHVKEKLKSIGFRRLSFRPFDDRWIIYDDVLVARTNRRILGHMDGKQLGLLSCRQWGAIGSPTFDAVWITSEISDINFFRRGGAQVFPLEFDKKENLSPDFRAFLDARYGHHYAPEDIFGYIYAILHAPTYRTRYADFLRIDFPRIPFPETRDHFESLAALGWRLVQVHLMHEKPKAGLAVYHGKGRHEVEKVAYACADQSLHINATQSFAPVPQAVWDFHIGGYQVIDKYLKSRRGRVLSLDEIDQVTRIAHALDFTIRQMQDIDAAYAQAFPG